MCSGACTGMLSVCVCVCVRVCVCVCVCGGGSCVSGSPYCNILRSTTMSVHGPTHTHLTHAAFTVPLFHSKCKLSSVRLHRAPGFTLGPGGGGGKRVTVVKQPPSADFFHVSSHVLLIASSLLTCTRTLVMLFWRV